MTPRGEAHAGAPVTGLLPWHRRKARASGPKGARRRAAWDAPEREAGLGDQCMQGKEEAQAPQGPQHPLATAERGQVEKQGERQENERGLGMSHKKPWDAVVVVSR